MSGWRADPDPLRTKITEYIFTFVVILLFIMFVGFGAGGEGFSVFFVAFILTIITLIGLVWWSEYKEREGQPDRYNMPGKDYAFIELIGGKYPIKKHVIDGEVRGEGESVSYLMEKYGWSYDKAYSYLGKFRIEEVRPKE